MTDQSVLDNRKLERELFGAWCQWLCRPPVDDETEHYNKKYFTDIANQVEQRLSSTAGPYFLSDFGTSDIIFTPYIERMNASLFYYKGYDLRKEHPVIGKWFDAMETRENYRGTQSDFHTHAHDLPP